MASETTVSTDFPSEQIPDDVRDIWEEFYNSSRDLNPDKKKEVDLLWEKWKSLIVPTTLQEKCVEQAKPLLKLLFQLQETALSKQSPSLTKQAWEDLGEYTGALIIGLSRASLVVGREYKGRLWTRKPSQHVVDLLRVICEPTFAFTTKLLSSDSFDDFEVSVAAYAIGRMARSLAINCCIMGLEWTLVESPILPSQTTLPTPTHNSIAINQQKRSGFGYCESCGDFRSTWYVKFYQNIGFIIMRFEKHIQGNLCMECISKYFWQYTLTTMLLGWWGVISLIVTPIAILNNIIRYTLALIMPRITDLSSPKYTTADRLAIFFILLIGGVIGFYLLILLDFFIRANTYYMKPSAEVASGVLVSTLLCLGPWLVISLFIAIGISKNN